MKKHPTFYLTVDVDYTRGSEGGLEQIYDFCEKRQIRPTLFITGSFATEYRELMIEAARRGYDLGTHGWKHGENPDEDFRRASPELQRDWIVRSTQAVAEATGVNPRIFRAPNLWVSEQTIQILEDEGYVLDSSVPSHRFDLGYGRVNYKD